MATNLEFALMAGRAYQSTRDEINSFPTPNGWTIIGHDQKDDSGFEAVSFRNTSYPNEIVISFAGTYEKDIAGDISADITLGGGQYTEQLKQAAEYYMQVKAVNPDAKITLTGHSLGGGLASLIAVFFDEDAVTFDQAPFRLTAAYHDPLSPDLDPCAFLLSVLQDNAQIDQSLLHPLEEYVDAIHQGSLDVLQEREQDVTNTRVDGEFLSDIFPVAKVDFIGATPSANLLTHGETEISGTQLHSMALLAAFMESQQTATNGQTLNEVTTKLTDLLGMIFDENLFAHTTNPSNTTDVNFLERLIQNQTTAGGMITNFTTDMWQIAQDGGLTMSNNDLAKALIAFDMQAYYDNNLAPTGTLFNNERVAGGIHFDRTDVAAAYTNDDVKGYQYFANYLATLPEDERAAITQRLPNLIDWYIQAGDQAMTVTAAEQRAFMLGGTGEDHLTGGSQADVLFGNGGNDYLEGGGGQDILHGGDGDDAFYVGGYDNAYDEFQGGDGYDKIIGGAGDDVIRANSLTFTNSIEAIDGGAGTNYLKGTTGDDVIDLSGIAVRNIAGIDGGDGEDVLVGSTGDDTLIGGDDSDADILEGGAGNDTYYAGENDLVIDTDHSGALFYNGSDIAGMRFDFLYAAEGDEYYREAASGVTVRYDIAAATLSGLNGFCTISGYGKGDFGVNLVEVPPVLPPATRILTGSDGPDATAAAIVSNEGRYGFSGTISDGQASSLFFGWQEFSMNGAAPPPDLQIDGGAGNDSLIGLAGGDTISGGSGNDLISGEFEWTGIDPEESSLLNPWGATGAADILRGDGGMDVIAAGYGDDHVSGGDDNDFLAGGEGNDTVGGDRGNDVVTGATGDDLLFGGDGNDLLYGDGSLDAGAIVPDDIAALGFQLRFSGKGYATSVILNNFDVTDTQQAGDDTLFGGKGNDLLRGGSGSDILMGEEDHDTLFGGDGDDTLHGGPGNDWLVGDEGAGTAAAGRDILDGGAGDDLLSGNGGDDLLAGGAGQDTLNGDDGNDSLTGGSGNDLLYGGTGDDTYVFGRGDGTDTVWDADGGADAVRFADVGEGDIQVTRNQHDLILTVGETGDSISVSGWFDSASARIEQVEFADGTIWNEAMAENTITVAPGTGGNDVLYAGDNGDILTGGGGNDVLYGGLGNDTYVLDPDGGADVIQLDPGGTDTVAFGVGYDASGLTLYKSGADMITRLSDGSQFTFVDWFSDNGHAIEGFSFADGTRLTNTELFADNLVHGVGNAGNDTIYGYEGGDYLDGGGGYDFLYGGAGNDYLDGGSDSDTLYGEDGDDRLFGGADWGGDTLYGGGGDDWLDGGGWYDHLHGGAGSDTYFFARGYGRGTWLDDLIDPGSWMYTVGDAGEVDTLLFGLGITPNDLHLTWDGSTWDGSCLYLQIDQNYTDVLTLAAHPDVDGTPGGIEQLKFADGQTLSMADLLARLMRGTPGDDELYGSEAASTRIMDGGAGNDELNGCSADETLLGGDGDDFLDGGGNDWKGLGGGNDRIFGGTGNDSLRGSGWLDGGEGDDDLRGLSGEQVVGTSFVGGSGNDLLWGGGGDDILAGGTGNDTLDGGAGADTFVFNIGDGADFVRNYDWYGVRMSEDTIRFGAGIDLTSLSLIKAGSNLVVTIGDNGDQITCVDWYGGFDWLEPGRITYPSQIGFFSFADGTGLTADDLMLRKTLKVLGGSDDDFLAGDIGIDNISGGAGRDVLDGGPGDDLLDGGEGEDRYLFGPGSGMDRIEDSGEDAGNTIQLADGVCSGDVHLSRDGDDLILAIRNTEDQVTVTGWFLDPDMQVTFADGTVWDYPTLAVMAQPANVVNVIEGTIGNDVLTGGDGNDQLIGGSGSDTLLGGSGDDTFVVEGIVGGYDLFNGGDGVDTILGGAGDDTIRVHNFSGENTVEVIDGGGGTNVIAGTGYGDTIDLSGT
ncbi:MAG: calcium-binding protein, partial [Thermodesulfobacteriota bacterium]